MKTVIKSNRSHRIAYAVVLLALAIALATDLVLAGERSAREVNGSTQTFRLTPAAVFSVGDKAC